MSLLQREPIRTYLYGVLIAVLALLVGLGVVATALAPLYLAVGAAVLAVPSVLVTEVARAKVTPVVTVNHSDGLGHDVPPDRPSADHLDEDEVAAVEAVEAPES